jgi:hypothetical protein
VADPAPRPGWYVDPSGQHSWRWWSGQSWTDHVAGSAAADVSQALAGELDSELRIARLASWAPVLFVAASLLGLVAEWRLGGYLKTEFHWFDHAFDVSRTTNGTKALNTLPPPPSLALFGWIWLASPFTLASEVVLLIWQYRSAKVALRLRYPARISIGWGVAGWFVPVVQLFFPYLAVRSLLPDGHRTLRMLPLWWGSIIAASALVGALPWLAADARPLAVADVVAAVVANLVVGLSARAIVTAVVEDYRVAAGLLTSSAIAP